MKHARFLAAVLLSLPTLSPDASAQSSISMVTRAAARATRAGPPDNFTGTVRVQALSASTITTRLNGGTVTFEAGARTAWHTHPREQVLIVTDGIGRVQRWGGRVEEIRTGDVVRIPPGAKHWHGAAPTRSMTHIAIIEPLEGRTTEWMERVSDAQYDSGATRDDIVGTRPSAAQQLMGDIAPKLAQLTDSVLFGDVWGRPGLAPRDRSLVTVSALIAMNRPEQLRSHMGRALANGVTRDELIEAITHLAFYAGWPNAVTAVGAARQVFDESRPR